MKPAVYLPSISNDSMVSFLFFLTLNSLLAYGSFSLELQLWFFLGLISIFALTFVNSSKSTTNIQFIEKLPQPIPREAWIFVVLAGLSLRLYELFHYAWPVPDDGYVPYYSIELSKNWTWHAFFTNAQHPGLFNWLLALYYRIITPSLFSTGFFVFLISFLTLVVGYFPIRKYFPDTLAFIYFSLLSISFWPLFMVRFWCTFSIGFFLEVFALCFFVFLLQSSPKKRPLFALILGIVVGFGLFSTVPWPLLVAPIGIAVLKSCLSANPRRQWKVFFSFSLPVLISAIIFVGLSFQSKIGGYIHYLLFFQNGYSIWHQIIDFAGYITCNFWGTWDVNFYRPVWGGMLNPILDSFFLLGLIECWKCRKSSIVQWIFLSLIFCLIPSFISRGIEIYRIFLAIPFFFFIIAQGLQSLIKSLKPSIRNLLLASLLIPSCALDFHHLQKHLEAKWINSDAETQTSAQAYQILKTTYNEIGIGAFLSNIGPNMQNQTLLLSTFYFNAASNPRLTFADCHWIAVLVNGQYKPFLTLRFPTATYFILQKDSYWHYGNNVLIIIPLDDSNRTILGKWFETEQALQPITLNIFYAHDFENQKSFIRDFQKVYENVKSDRFLASTLVERMLFYKRADGVPPSHLDIIHLGLKDGYPLIFFKNAELALKRSE